MSRSYRVAYASIELAGLFAAHGPASFEEALRESWQPGASVSRYRRKWRISAPHEVEPGVLTGRIGFVRENELATLDFDEELNDFRRGVAPTGIVIPFAVQIPSQRVAFQLVAGQVRSASFTGAFESALNLSDAYRWRVRPLVKRTPFPSWRNGVDRITSFTFTLRRPNPHYPDDPVVEGMIEGLNAEIVRVAGRGEDIDDDDELFRQALDHTLGDYGTAVIRGEREGEESEWRSTDDGTVPAVARVESENEEELPEGELVPLLDDVGEVIAADVSGESDEDDY